MASRHTFHYHVPTNTSGTSMVSNKLSILALVVVSCCLHWSDAFQSGAPPDACSTNLTPVHGRNEPQPFPAPYTLAASSRSYSPNKPITVVLKGSGDSFKGFLIQAQDLYTGEPILSGEWRGVQAKQLPCAAVTHVNPSTKTKVELIWTPKGSGEVIFVATVVKSFDTFYTGIKSSSARASSGAINSFYDRDQKRTTSASTDFEDDPYETLSASQHKEDEAEAADSQDQYDSNYYGHYDPTSGYSQPDYTASSSAADAVRAPNPPDQAGYYSNPNHQFQEPPFQFQRPQSAGHSGSGFGNYPSPSFHSQQFAPPNQRFPFQQPFRTPWNYPRF